MVSIDGPEGLQNSTANMDRLLDPGHSTPGNIILVIWAREAWSCMGVFHSWFGNGQANPVMEGIISLRIPPNLTSLLANNV